MPPTARGYKQTYSPADLEKAIEYAQNKPIREAARIFGPSESTIRYQLLKRASAPASPSESANCTLSNSTELELITWIKNMGARYSPPTKRQVLQILAAELASRWRPADGAAANARIDKWIQDGEAGDKLWRGFKERHPECHLLLENKMEQARAAVTQAEHWTRF